jgi:Galactosyltransferase
LHDVWNRVLSETPLTTQPQRIGGQVSGTSEMMWNASLSESPINQTSYGIWNETPSENPIQVSKGLWNATPSESPINQTFTNHSSSTEAHASLRQGSNTEETVLPRNSIQNASLWLHEQGSSVSYSFFKPRILVGIISDSQTKAASTLRNFHRKLFQLWNDSRLCSLHEYKTKQSNESSYYTTFGDENLSYDCQIVYSFILGAYSKNTSSPYFADDVQDIPTIRLYDTPDQPVDLDTVPLSNITALDNDNIPPPYNDILEHRDGTFLNIVENMDQGKTPTFLFWASKVSSELNIPYIAKCDSDSIIDLNGLLEFLHQQLPKIPAPVGNQVATLKQPSVVAGSPILRKELNNGWFLTSTNESFWEEEYFMGAHLYYNGGFYLMSRDLAESATFAARKLEDVFPRIVSFSARKLYNIGPKYEDKPHSYLEGVEDHDAISTAEHGHYDPIFNKNDTVPSIIQWLVIPQYSRFHEHPAKTGNHWGPLLKREERAQKSKEKTNPTPTAHGSSFQSVDTHTSHPEQSRSLIVVYGATLDTVRANYRSHLHAQGINVCSGLLPQAQQQKKVCDIHYFFVVGRDDSSEDIPMENIHNISELTSINSNSSIANINDEDDVLLLNVNGTNMEGLGLSTLYFIEEQAKSGSGNDIFDLIVFCNASHIVNLQQWRDNIVSTAQYSVGKDQHKYLLIGDVRDKGRNQREFKATGCPDPVGFFKSHKSYAPHWIQLYLGSECFAFSSNLVPLWLEKASDPEIERCTEGHMGHDLTYLSYTTKATMHWMRVPNSLKFWSKLE